jgi:RND family efflux transporter MFP subunit
MKRKLRWCLLAAGILGVVAAGILVLSDRAGSAAKAGAAPKAIAAGDPKVVMVTVDPVTPRSVQRRVQVVGSLWGRDEVGITPKVEGRIEKIYAFVGDVVKPGDVLMEIEQKNYQLAVNEAARALELELAKLNLTALPTAAFELDKLPSIAKALAQEKLAVASLERLKKLVGLAQASQEERDKAEADVAVARANSRQMRLDAETTLATVRHKLALLDTATQKLRDTRVVVPPAAQPLGASAFALPVEYVVGQRNASEGETVSALVSAAPVFRLVIADPLKLLATIPERYIAEVNNGQRVEIRVEAFGDEIFPAVVARVNPTVDRASRTFQAEILMRNPARRLHAGSFAKGAILTRIDGRALTVPNEALVVFAGVTKVFVLRGDKVVDVPVSAGVRFEDDSNGRRRSWVEVQGKLQAGDQVVTSGQSQLADGTVAAVRSTSK